MKVTEPQRDCSRCDLRILESESVIESVIESESVSASEIKAAYARTTCLGEVGWMSFCIEAAL